jgi:hypothetical protein
MPPPPGYVGGLLKGAGLLRKPEIPSRGCPGSARGLVSRPSCGSQLVSIATRLGWGDVPPLSPRGQAGSGSWLLDALLSVGRAASGNERS